MGDPRGQHRAGVRPVPVPLPAGAVTDALAPFGRSRTLPAAAYVDPAVLAWERRHMFAESWVCVGRVADLRGLTHAAVTAGDVGVLLTLRASDVRAFGNVCRHRGHELLP